MEKGILLLAFGKRAYGFLAYNMAVSIRHFNKDIPILLIHDGQALNQLTPNQLAIFSKIVKAPVDLKNPGLSKITLMMLSPFQHTLYLDTDGMATKDIGPLFDILINSNSDFATVITDNYRLSEGDNVQKLNWAYGNDIFEHYKLPKDGVLPCNNTSIIYFRATKKAGEIFQKILKGFDFPFEKLKLSWGGTMPDELPVSVALMGEENIALPVGTIFFGNRPVPQSDNDLIESFYFISIYGGKNYTKLRYHGLYDREMAKYYRAMGEDYLYKYTLTIGDKHANRSAPVFQKPHQAEKLPSLHPALIPIDRTLLIDSSKLIQTYEGPRKETVRVTNWLNSTMIEFNEKIYFVYRMESAPFCTRMKLGICLLDENLAPIQSTNKLLNLHSDLKGFVKGFHVEDPRLFTFNNELYLSYTDGYQMAQAKINPETLEAVESFYLDKPVATRTEKNWTFFESEGQLYSNYSYSPHTIFKIDGPKWEQVYQTPFLNDWKWGEIRGGTSPYLIDDKFVSFFHSAMDIQYKHSRGRQYFMGAIVFSATAPFEILHISKEPIIAGELTKESIPRLSNKIFVVFPSGVVKLEDGWAVSFGYNDHECRIVNISDEFLETNLKNVTHDKTELIGV